MTDLSLYTQWNWWQDVPRRVCWDQTQHEFWWSWIKPGWFVCRHHDSSTVKLPSSMVNQLMHSHHRIRAGSDVLNYDTRSYNKDFEGQFYNQAVFPWHADTWDSSSVQEPLSWNRTLCWMAEMFCFSSRHVESCSHLHWPFQQRKCLFYPSNFHKQNRYRHSLSSSRL